MTITEWYSQRADAITCIALARGITNGQERGLTEFLTAYPHPAYLAAAIALEAAYMAPVPNRELWQAIAALRELARMEDEPELGHG